MPSDTDADLPKDAVMVAPAVADTAVVVTGKVTEEVPAFTATLDGTETVAAEPLAAGVVIVTDNVAGTSPVAGALPSSVTVAVVAWPPVTVGETTATDTTDAGSTT